MNGLNGWGVGGSWLKCVCVLCVCCVCVCVCVLPKHQATACATTDICPPLPPLGDVLAGCHY